MIGNRIIFDHIKKGIWVYLFLLIFEGSLRKWIFPAFSNPLLIIRDPVAVWLLYTSIKRGIIYTNGYLKFVLAITLLGFLTALIWGHGNFIVALFGARITLLHFPLIFLIGKVLTKNDVIQMGKFIVLLSIPMTLLIAVQFYSPQSAFINRGIGGNLEGGGFQGTADYFRPPATFSFITGTANFYSLAAPFILFFLFHNKSLRRILVYLAVLALLLAIPLSISRSLFFSVMISLSFTIISLTADRKKINQILIGIASTVLILLILNTLNIFNTSISAFTERFTMASEQEGGVLEGTIGTRFLGGLFNSFYAGFNGQIPFFGGGIGKGTNVGAQILVGDNTQFLVDEGEWGRIIGEMGLLMGLCLIISRVALTFKLSKLAYISLRNKNALPWLLFSYSFLMVLQSQWATPTVLGFFVIGTGLTLASLNDNKYH